MSFKTKGSRKQGWHPGAEGVKAGSPPRVPPPSRTSQSRCPLVCPSVAWAVSAALGPSPWGICSLPHLRGEESVVCVRSRGREAAPLTPNHLLLLALWVPQRSADGVCGQGRDWRGLKGTSKTELICTNSTTRSQGCEGRGEETALSTLTLTTADSGHGLTVPWFDSAWC